MGDIYEGAVAFPVAGEKLLGAGSAATDTTGTKINLPSGTKTFTLQFIPFSNQAADIAVIVKAALGDGLSRAAAHRVTLFSKNGSDGDYLEKFTDVNYDTLFITIPSHKTGGIGSQVLISGGH